MKQFSNELSYEVFEDGYEIFLHGDRWMVQHEPNIPNHEMTYEENAIWHCEQLDDMVNPEKVLASYKAAKVCDLKNNLKSFLETATVKSSCHGAEKEYSVSSEKQQLLAALIQKKQYADENEVAFEAYWNARGEVAEPYTLEELQQLSIEIYNFVQKYVSAEQRREQAINACGTQEEVDALEITFD